MSFVDIVKLAMNYLMGYFSSNNQNPRDSCKHEVNEINEIDTEDDGITEVYGYKENAVRKIVAYYLMWLSGGLLKLIFYWLPHFQLLFTHDKCCFYDADSVLLVNRFQSRHTTYHVRKIEKKKNSMSENANHYRSFTPYSLSFEFKKLTYVYQEFEGKFEKLSGLDRDSTIHDLGLLGKSGCIRETERSTRRDVYGPNELSLPSDGFTTLLISEILDPFYIFQAFSFCLWILDGYYCYAFVILATSCCSIVAEVVQTQNNQRKLRETVSSSNDEITLFYNTFSNNTRTVPIKELIPGDVIVLSSSQIGSSMPCDAFLIQGQCIVDESMLTGESLPFVKTSTSRSAANHDLYDDKKHARHTLYSGTKILQVKNIGCERVIAIVLRTGFSTTKGKLIRSILYPPPLDYQFEQDSYKFVGLLAIVACFGVAYTFMTKLAREIPLYHVILNALDLVTIVVPPALPAAMSIGRIVAQGRLEAKRIFCTSPRSINVAGSIDCVCFDKTGTLTEPDFSMRGVVPCNGDTRQFQPIVIDASSRELDSNEHLTIGMASCHSIVTIDGQSLGDPLDLKMFEFTGWKLSRSSESELSCMEVESPYRFARVGVVKQFSFCSGLQRMSVVSKRSDTNEYCVYCKGSPEIILSLSKADTVPEDYNSILHRYTSAGYRVIALAFKTLRSTRNIETMERDEAESALIFLGFVVFENRLKAETASVIDKLNEAAIKVVMVTGDNESTALTVAKNCGIVRADSRVVKVNIDECSNNVYFTNHSDEKSSTKSEFSLDTDYSRSANQECLTKNNVVFSLTGSTWVQLKRIKGSEGLHNVIRRGAVFARMSPDHKQQLVEELQNLDYRVAMTGDGANDCGALRVAHAGISLSDSESSIAAPFTSRGDSIACVLDVVRQGRAALVTSFGLFKYMAAYSLTQFLSVLLLYSVESNLTDVQFLYIDLFVISSLAFFFGQTEALDEEDSPMHRRPPTDRLLNAETMLGLGSQMLLVGLLQCYSLWELRNEEWFVPFDANVNDALVEESASAGCYENYTVFVVSSLQYVILAIVFSTGWPYRKPVWTNREFMISSITLAAFTVYLAIGPCAILAGWFELVVPEELNFKFTLLTNAAMNFFLALFTDYLTQKLSLY
ncbi:probable cation-transporting ATPase W08D2.5 isoform X1 [Trichogramma pretiosum]|uniref:probable cation-transporting ATPase W08D2.5 isoform X1 n=2 Tax=Trichogramma pretiosum TaxID=7493 RepID=UPI0006C9DD78|nr:probable cation-transporting ATPase W08D2.5 isoform X1 [Trichogramma pretiosum]